MTKPQLRAQLKAARLTLSAEERAAASQAINARLQAVLDWSSVRNVHAFEPLLDLGEVNITPFVQSLQCSVVHPRQQNGEWVLEQEPYDVILVPMLGFDTGLHRIGYGGGYYDKFLAGQPQAVKIGVCFEIGRIEQLPIESHDIALNCVVTESAVYGDLLDRHGGLNPTHIVY